MLAALGISWNQLLGYGDAVRRVLGAELTARYVRFLWKMIDVLLLKVQ